MRFLVSLFLVFAGCQSAPKSHAITHSQTAGRLGDKLLGYSQARYLSYITQLPFLYQPFANSKYFSIKYKASPLKEGVYQHTFHVYNAETLAQFFQKIQDPQTPATLFQIEYFTDTVSEWKWPHSDRKVILSIPWQDEKFSSYLKNSLKPKRMEVPKLTVSDRLNVAIHVRTPSNGDDAKAVLDCPLKLPNIEYQFAQLNKLYEWNGQKPLHVFLFSDTNKPALLLDAFKDRFQDKQIDFHIQLQPKSVVHDFFAMQEFDVLIATHSNFAAMASRLGDFDMVFLPIHFKNGGIDQVKVIAKASSWFPYTLTMIQEDEPVKGELAKFGDISF